MSPETAERAWEAAFQKAWRRPLTIRAMNHGSPLAVSGTPCPTIGCLPLGGICLFSLGWHAVTRRSRGSACLDAAEHADPTLRVVRSCHRDALASLPNLQARLPLNHPQQRLHVPHRKRHAGVPRGVAGHQRRVVGHQHAIVVVLAAGCAGCGACRASPSSMNVSW